MGSTTGRLGSLLPVVVESNQLSLKEDDKTGTVKTGSNILGTQTSVCDKGEDSLLIAKR